jgi:hypothetical protein
MFSTTEYTCEGCNKLTKICDNCEEGMAKSASPGTADAAEITGLCLVCDDELVEWGLKEKVEKKKAATAPEELKARCSMCLAYDVCKLTENRTWGKCVYTCSKCSSRLVPCNSFADCRGLACAAQSIAGFDEDFCNWCGGSGGLFVPRWCGWCKTNCMHKEVSAGVMGSQYVCQKCSYPGKTCMMCSEAMAKINPTELVIDDDETEKPQPDAECVAAAKEESEKFGNETAMTCQVCFGRYAKWEKTLREVSAETEAEKANKIAENLASAEAQASAAKTSGPKKSAPVKKNDLNDALNAPAPDEASLPSGRTKTNTADGGEGCTIL